MTNKTNVVPDNSFSSGEDQHRVPAPDFLSTYANNVTMSISQWDVNVIFGEIAGRSEDGKAIVLQKVRINMSKELAKVFKILLETHLNVYEGQFGEINIPDITKFDSEKNNAILKEASKGNIQTVKKPARKLK